tara:strand:- start:22944 stop:23084 length:141 start_codon:yes stop_codon:yes gene_type:complete
MEDFSPIIVVLIFAVLVLAHQADSARNRIKKLEDKNKKDRYISGGL